MRNHDQIIDIENYLLTTKFIVELCEKQLLHIQSSSECNIEKFGTTESVSYSNGSLRVHDLVIPLQYRPTTDRLVRSFFDNPEQYITKEMIISTVYNIDTRSVSPRLLESCHQKLNKLMSRSRKFIHSACTTAGIDQYSWIFYDHDYRGWKLYRKH